MTGNTLSITNGQNKMKLDYQKLFAVKQDEWMEAMHEIDRLENLVKSLCSEKQKMIEALNKIKSPDFGGVHGMIISDMGFQHFAQHTADSILKEII